MSSCLVGSEMCIRDRISTIGPEFLEGHYGAWNYMMSIDTPASKKFAASFKKRWGADRVVADPQESAYNMVYLWKQAVEDAGTFDDNAVREALVGQTLMRHKVLLKLCLITTYLKQ